VRKKKENKERRKKERRKKKTKTFLPLQLQLAASCFYKMRKKIFKQNNT